MSIASPLPGVSIRKAPDTIILYYCKRDYRRIGHAKAGPGSVEFLFCCHLLFKQDRVALQILARLFPGGERLIQPRLDLLRIDLSDKVPFSYRLPEIHSHAGDAPADLRLDRSPDL